MTTPALDPRVSGALSRYRVMAVITGTFLLAVCVGMVLKYLVGVDNPTFLTITSYIAIVHGWVYIVYLATTVHLWMLMRWGFKRLIVMALGGIVPFLSFFLERRFAVEVSEHAPGTLDA